tara:strand:+ start:1073 stop:1339 length:267 start_codon:yes stop_codon:yes gene_type:complete
MKPDFKKGDYYQSKNDIGYIDFISSDYITLVVREIPRDERTAKNAVNKLIQVKVLVFPGEWSDMKKLDKPNRYLTKSNKNSLTLDDWA